VSTNLRTFDGIINDSDWDASAALAINDQGQIVGYSNSPAHDGTKAAFLYEDGEMINLNDYLKPELDWQLTSATDINELGQIIGVGLKNGVLTSYLLTPTELTQVPLPASAWLFASGLAAFIAARRKQKNLRTLGKI
jgi:probable HAF family extracellular repeat protein